MSHEQHAIHAAALPLHVVAQAARRRISESEIRDVLASPGQVLQVRAGRVVAQSLVEQESRAYILRVFVDVDREPPEVVTAYRSSKIGKYWRAT